MASLPSQLSARVQAVAGIEPELRPATRPEFGHFQSNVALRLAKSERKSPREVAADIVARLDVDDLCEPVEIAGPGFLNFRLRSSVLAGYVTGQLADPALGVEQAEHPQRVVIDYSSPNVAKQMHVGHLRTTIIGDCFNRVLTAAGHEVLPQNHLGDWGTQFGQLVEQILVERLDPAALDLVEAEELYKRAAAHFKDDHDFADRARLRVVALQSGDEETLRIWRSLVEVSLAGFNTMYARLHVLLTDEHLAGESIYNAVLGPVADELKAKGVAVVDDGALCVFVPGFNAPLILRKRDGGYGYDVTDLAALLHRVRDLKADRLIYVTDVRQGDHFAQVFAVARMAGWLPDTVSAEHVGYGMVLGADGRPYKTRDGKAMHLATLLDMAEEIASPPIALAAIKYADLSNGLNQNYVFDIERMVATTGNTGPYLQYAHARMTQVLARAAAEGVLPAHEAVTVLDEPQEQALALLLSGYGDVVAEVASTLQPHKLCAYLYDLAGTLSVFYERCPVLRSEGEVRSSRLALCAATKRVLAAGLDLLGIEALDRM
ncbi:arginine--tRNA ligase [Microlunatus antarcticus]|uniref:Arginine--tRNA ligase n=1 Tax=Microlunatus antarcticus TaxID=53388 RepID=A0A7W5JZD4_9ACTN|nr:arginine--tRNA ligase [Microlunatus antarcticus]MBB3329115.1 arginyl-tRNA synthetase [Microlunatus antarcticus]